jgi:hypothetical protein
MDNSNFKAFLLDVKKRATHFAGEEYISEDVRKVLRDFLQAAESFSALQTDSVSVGADARVFKKRFEQSKLETKAAEKRIELMKSAGLAAIIPVRVLGQDITSVTDPALAARMKTAVQKIAEALIEISKI